MGVPCPVQLQGPWSPVGYRVVEVADEKVPATDPPPQASRGQRKKEISEPPCLPWSPVGYRVVEVAEERNPRPVPAPRVGRPPRKLKRLVRWGALAGGGSLLLAVALALLMVRLPTRASAVPPAVPAAEGTGRPVEPGRARSCGQADRAGGQLPDRETYGTAVAFVRNPAEAARIAREERKLTFLLHLSGDLEEARFT